MKKLAALSLLLLASGAAALEAGPFTPEQAKTGRAQYVANCAACHGAGLKGAGEAPVLAGTTFMAAWGARSSDELYSLIKASMPYGNGNSLDAAVYRGITAYILSANGVAAGGKVFTGTENVKIASVADGKVPAMADAPTAAAAARPATSYPATRFGLTVPGSLKSYTPVTDEMLAHQNDADWLMYRRNYQGWSHSPLAQVTTANVKNLQLQWSWAMNDGGASQVTPIIHDGIMFLSGTANTVQALDARTGELIWENRIGPAPTRAYGATRSIALYGDKV
ncbi:MAG TPA: c-type cytochrome, partial [Rhizomicrobium sp.]|nr:c-type cytochrome [Rhizomicrobium sp.]